MKSKQPTHYEDLIYGASSSSTSPRVGDYEGGTEKQKGNGYEVFLNFRGEDTRKGFTDHLYASLIDAGIHVFRDNDKLRVGEEIGPELLYSITQSLISIPIISENYASSKWCLRELVQMLECRRSRGQVVLPIFYKVEPSQVRHLLESFGNAIDAHKKNSNQMVVKEWEDALKEVSSLKGWESEKFHDGYEADLVKMVVRRVMSELKRLFQLNVPKHLVGTNDHVEQIMSKIDVDFSSTWIIGIYGMGGIGKTTLAKVLYNKLSSNFENHSFLANIRETSQHRGIECLQKQLISNIVGSSWEEVSNVDQGISILKSRCKKKKVLALLDDIDDITHLDALVGDGSWFGVGSIVIVTTRNKSILDKIRIGHLYELNELSLSQSLILFSRHAFRNDFPPSGYVIISIDVVSNTGGLPLALEVIGSFLCGKTNAVWKDTSKKLEKVPHEKVQERLRISYEALGSEEKQFFLDIACFFIGSPKQNPTYMWDACGFYPRKGIEVLSLMSLIKIDEYGTLMMHDQLRDFGREIVRLENEKKVERRSRLWNYEEARNVLENNKGTSEIEALCLGHHTKRKSYRGEHLNELTNLRFLQGKNMNFTGKFQNLLPQLRWLELNCCPRDFNVAKFHLKKLVVLDLSYSEISKFWRRWGPLKMAPELKVLNLTCCVKLRRTPNLSAFKNLEILIFRGSGLKEICPSIGKLALLTELQLGPTLITKLPESIGNLQNLRILNIELTLVTELPSAVGMLAKLRVLRAFKCYNLKGLPNSIGGLVSLNELHLGDSGIRGLPESISKLSSLQHLDVTWCWNLGEIPELPSSLTTLHIDFPTPSLPFLSKLTLLQELSLFDLRPLECLPELPVQLSKVYLRNSEPMTNVDKEMELRFSELIRDKSSGLRKATKCWENSCWLVFDIE